MRSQKRTLRPSAPDERNKSEMRECETKHLGALDLAGALLEQIRSVVDQKRKAKMKSKTAVMLFRRTKPSGELK
jgi:hypothetical protein